MPVVMVGIIIIDKLKVNVPQFSSFDDIAIDRAAAA
jgi:hypothetical protein